MKKFWRYVFPGLFGLLIYTSIRLVNDSMSKEQFWHRSIYQNTIEVSISIVMAYVFDAMLRFFIRKFNDRKEKYAWKSVVREFGIVCLASVLLVNIILYLIHFLINIPLTLADFVIGNIIAILYVLLYYSIVRGNRLVKSYVEQKVQLEKLKNENLQSELKFLKAQYHPHFLFNALNTIYFKMDYDVPGAKKTVEKFSELLRYQLYDQQEMVSVEKEINHLKNFADLQKERSSEKLKLEWKLDTRLDDRKIYPMLLLPLVENAFKYVGGNYEICIATALEDDKLCFVVRNSICKQPLNNKPGIGLDNLKRRLNLLYQVNYSLNVESDTDNFLAELKIPLQL